MRDEDFKLFMEGVKQMVEHYHGLRHDLRTMILPMPPEQMDAAAIRALRERIGTSQAVFAMALNVSTKTVQAWESGARKPDGGNLGCCALRRRIPKPFSVACTSRPRGRSPHLPNRCGSRGLLASGSRRRSRRNRHARLNGAAPSL